jgi:hypothetical protein
MLAKKQETYFKGNEESAVSPTYGVKNVAFAHEAAGGETAIQFNSLSYPASWLAKGYGSLSGAYLVGLQLARFARNVVVTSSLNDVIQKSEYVVRNDRIEFDSYTLTAGEIIEVEVSDVLVGGGRLVDQRILKQDGVLLDGEDTITIGGFDIDVDNEQIMLFVDGQQLFKNTDNLNDNSGNYRYINVSQGRSNEIVLNETVLGDTAYRIVSVGAVIDDPNYSTFLEIAKLQGQVDVIIPTLASLAGVPEGDFQVAANNVDLKSFLIQFTKLVNNFNALLDKLDADAGVNDTDYRSSLEV